jgi:large subunit ribosomal protein L35
MPKLKTKSGAKKRFKVTGSGKIKRKKAFKNHILTKKGTKQKRRLSSKTTVKKVDEGNIKPMLPYLV